MIQTAEADIVCPSVAAEDPLGLLGQEILILQDGLRFIGAVRFQSCNKLLCSRAVRCAVLIGSQPLISSCLHAFGLLRQSGNLIFQAGTQCIGSKEHTETKLCVILEQGVIPCRAMAFFVLCVRSGR